MSKLQRSLSKEIFQDVSHEALGACLESLVVASQKLAKSKTKLDALLFLIKHLLILREQLTPFDMGNASEETLLDFSTLKLFALNFFYRYKTPL